jgi:hypothetical protein
MSPRARKRAFAGIAATQPRGEVPEITGFYRGRGRGAAWAAARARRRRASAVYYALLERLRSNPIARCRRVVELHMEWERRK